MKKILSYLSLVRRPYLIFLAKTVITRLDRLYLYSLGVLIVCVIFLSFISPLRDICGLCNRDHKYGMRSWTSEFFLGLQIFFRIIQVIIVLFLFYNTRSFVHRIENVVQGQFSHRLEVERFKQLKKSIHEHVGLVNIFSIFFIGVCSVFDFVILVLIVYSRILKIKRDKSLLEELNI